MSFLSGENITAARLNRLQPQSLRIQGSSTDVPVSSSTVDVPGMTVNVDTTVPNSKFFVTVVTAFYNTSAPGGAGSSRLYVDGTAVGNFAIFQSAGSTDKGTVTQTYDGTIALAGVHEFKLVATTPSGMTIRSVNCSMVITIVENA